jgi:nucleotide-binding universal stress UspA family protein
MMGGARLSAARQKSSKKHRHIACATRGGTASRATEDAAIALASEQAAALTFLYVVDVRFAAGLSGKFTLDAFENEVRNIGELVLEQAVARAKERGVVARGEIREGHVCEEIERFLLDQKDLDVLVVGHMSEDLHERLEPVLQQMARHRVQVVVVQQTGAGGNAR